MFDTKFCKNRSRPLTFRRNWIFFYGDIKFLKFDVFTKLPLWGSQNRATYFLKETTLWNWWGNNMGIPIHILFFSTTIAVNKIKLHTYAEGSLIKIRNFFLFYLWNRMRVKISNSKIFKWLKFRIWKLTNVQM